MPLKLSDILYKTKKVTVDLGDGDLLEFEFKVNYHTPAFQAALLEAKDPLEFQLQAIADNVVKWNVTDDTKNPVPLTVDLLKQFGIDFANAIYAAMVEGRRPNPTKASS